ASLDATCTRQLSSSRNTSPPLQKISAQYILLRSTSYPRTVPRDRCSANRSRKLCGPLQTHSRSRPAGPDNSRDPSPVSHSSPRGSPKASQTHEDSHQAGADWPHILLVPAPQLESVHGEDDQ